MEASDFEAYFRVMYPKLVRFAQRRVAAELAEDLAAAALQTIWVKDVAAPVDEHEERQLQSLAYRVLDGLLRNAWRSERAARALMDTLVRQPEERQPDVAEEVAASEWPGWAERLSMTDREVLGLLVDGYKVREIAIILDCSPAAVTMRLQRARKNARRLWQREVARYEERRP